MYNRYVPQSDGTWRRSRVDPPRKPPEPSCPPENPSPCPEPPQENTPPCPPPPKHSVPRKPCSYSKNQSVGSFLKNLFPADFDTGDLLILLLLLLMAGDNPEDRDHALLTLAIYFFL